VSSVRIPPVLRDAVGGQRSLPASGATVRDVLDDLFANHPVLRDRVTEDGELSRFINVYVNDRDVRFRDGLATPVGDDDTVILLPAMAGGAG
jgi:molybdopterin converting factor small subunit